LPEDESSCWGIFRLIIGSILLLLEIIGGGAGAFALLRLLLRPPFIEEATDIIDELGIEVKFDMDDSLV
jgi:hypothetical protein